MTRRTAIDFSIHKAEAETLRRDFNLDDMHRDTPAPCAVGEGGDYKQFRVLIYDGAMTTYVRGRNVVGESEWRNMGDIPAVMGEPFHGVTIWTSTIVALLLRRLTDLAAGKITATVPMDDVTMFDLDLPAPAETTPVDDATTRRHDLDLMEAATTALASRARAAVLIDQIVQLNRRASQDYEFIAHREISPLREQLRECDLSPAELEYAASNGGSGIYSERDTMRRLAREVKRWRELVAPDASDAPDALDPRDPNGYDDARHG